MVNAFLDIVEVPPMGELDTTAHAETAWLGFCRLLPSGAFPTLSNSNVDGVMTNSHMTRKPKVNRFGETILARLIPTSVSGCHDTLHLSGGRQGCTLDY